MAPSGEACRQANPIQLGKVFISLFLTFRIHMEASWWRRRAACIDWFTARGENVFFHALSPIEVQLMGQNWSCWLKQSYRIKNKDRFWSFYFQEALSDLNYDLHKRASPRIFCCDWDDPNFPKHLKGFLSPDFPWFLVLTKSRSLMILYIPQKKIITCHLYQTTTPNDSQPPEKISPHLI